MTPATAPLVVEPASRSAGRLDPAAWDLAVIMEFTSIDALRAYQRHPQHLAVMAFNDTFVAHVASIDFTRTERGAPAAT